VRASLIGASLSGGNCGGLIDNGGFNLADDGTCGFNQVADLGLGPLTDNGGPTLTHLPQAGSPALDFVALGCPPPATDQRGAPRPFDGNQTGGAQCDAGAVEAGVLWIKVRLPFSLR
jgi:hypothetical protein